jgi:hypothetical protein
MPSQLRRPWFARWLVLLTSLGFLSFAGCEPGRGDISGEITYKGEPVSFGRISFVGQGAQQGVPYSYIIRGKYAIKGCPAGPVKVSIESFPPPDPETLKSKKAKGPAADMARHLREPPPEILELASGPKLKHVPIPKEYANSESSGLTYEVSVGVQTKDFPLDK